MQRIKDLFEDDSAVSPVIGVILMVAITVILAAVIASFVLGLGNNTDDVSPNIVMEQDYADLGDGGNNGTVTLTVSTADADADNETIFVRGPAVNNTDWTSSLDAGSSQTIDLAANAEEGDEYRLIFETEDSSDTLNTWALPQDE